MKFSSAREKGITFLGFLILLALIGFFCLLVLRVGPIYLNHYKVVSSLESLKKEPELHAKSKDEILVLLERRWNINMVEHVTRKDVFFQRDNGQLEIQVAYDVTQHVAGNLDVLVHFDEAIQLGPSD